MTLGALESLAWSQSSAFLGGEPGGRLALVSAASVLLCTYLVIHLKPISFHRTKRALPELDDDDVLLRVAELATAVGAPLPTVRVVTSMSGELQSLAWALGILGPTLVLTDGILYRLPPAERDAIIAHELSHLARRSAWTRLGVAPLAGVLGVASLTLTSPLAALGLGLAVFTLLSRVRSRNEEIACDCRAATALGSVTVSAALEKIHATHPITNTGLLSLLVYATASHPHLRVRRDALRRASSNEEAEGIDVDPAPVKRLRLASVGALVLGVLLVIAGVLAGRGPFHGALGLVPLLLVPMTPRVLLAVSLRRQLALARRRLAKQDRLPGSRLQFAGLLLSLTALFAVLLAVELRSVPGLALACGVGALGLLLLLAGAPRNTRARRLRRKVVAAFLAGDYSGALAVGADDPDGVGRDPVVKHNLALAAAVTGDRDRARADLEALGETLPLSSLSLAALLMSQDPQAALALAERDAQRLPDDPKPLAMKARALRRLERLDEAEEVVRAARVLDPRDGSILAIGASVAMKRGQFQHSSDLLVEALALSPGGAYPLYVRAELAAAAGESWASDALAEALKAAKAAPFSFVEQDVLRIRHGAP